ncbi:MAG: putative Na+/H+ antiporter [Noviherbaspirillum sp.]
MITGFWAFILIALMAAVQGGHQAIDYVESRQYTEPLFVFVIMVVAASRPVLEAVKGLVDALARLAPAFAIGLLLGAVANRWKQRNLLGWAAIGAATSLFPGLPLLALLALAWLPKREK